MRKIKTEITIQTEEVLIVRASRRASRTQCHQCSGETLMVTPEEAMALAGENAREIYRWVEAGWVHYTEMPGGSLLVCLDSILKLAVKAELSD